MSRSTSLTRDLRKLRRDLRPLFTVVSWVLRLLGRVAYRYRAGLAPVWTAVAVAGAGLALHTWASTWWWCPALVAAIAAPALLAGGGYLGVGVSAVLTLAVPDRLDTGRKGVLDRPTERVYLATLIGVCGGATAWTAAYGLPGPWWLLSAVLVFGAPWWWHRGWRRRKRPNRWAMRWTHVGEAIKELAGSKVVGHDGNRAVTELHVELRSGQTIHDVGDKASKVASALSPRLRSGAVTLAEGTSARRMTVRIVPRDPWRGTIAHPLGEIGSVDLDHDPDVMIGRLEDGRDLLHTLRQHTMIIAKSGGGKSVMGDGIIAWMVISGSAVVAIDMAGGVSIGGWEPVLAAPLATTVAQATELLGGVMAVVEHRESAMKRRGVKQWDGPDLFVVMDEFPSLVKAGGRQIVTALTILAERARKTRVWLYPLAQNGTKDDVGSTELRAQMMCTLGGRLDTHMNKVLWGDGARAGWDGTNLAVGTWLLRDAARSTPRVAKGVYLTDVQQERLVTAVATTETALDAGSLAALCGGPAVLDDAPADEVAAAPVAVELSKSAWAPQPRRLTVVASSPSPPDALDERVLAALPARGAERGVGATVLARQLGGTTRDQVERSLRRLAKAGSARRGDGKSGWTR